jgi:hypothetical protein|tara:strand:- start:647 stop:1171 length:525 start_codon:yes stop_codon:yes gene_type:complete
MNLDFLDEYWNIVGSEQGTQAIRQNKHFEPLTNVLLKNNSLGIPEDKIPVKYRPWKKWDMHFPQSLIALEYKSITSKSIEKCKYLRVEEALGSAVDLKKQNSNYRLGFLLVFAFPFENDRILSAKKYMINAFDDMVSDGIYDFFCPLQTNSVGNHYELSKKNSFKKFMMECELK